MCLLSVLNVQVLVSNKQSTFQRFEEEKIDHKTTTLIKKKTFNLIINSKAKNFVLKCQKKNFFFDIFAKFCKNTSM